MTYGDSEATTAATFFAKKSAKASESLIQVHSITWSYQAGVRPTWFSSRSTVFYYSASALPAAQGLARIMKTLTKQDFAIQRGAGLGVDPSRRNVTLFVHFIKE